MRPLPHVTFKNLYFELGANSAYPTYENGPKGFFGIKLPVLGVDPDNPSFDLTFQNIVGHNGNGTIQLALGGSTNKAGVASNAHDITIEGEHDRIDQNNIADDRVVIDGVTHPAPGRLGQMYNIKASNISTYVSDSVSVGSVNSFKINSAQKRSFRRNRRRNYVPRVAQRRLWRSLADQIFQKRFGYAAGYRREPRQLVRAQPCRAAHRCHELDRHLARRRSGIRARRRHRDGRG